MHLRSSLIALSIASSETTAVSFESRVEVTVMGACNTIGGALRLFDACPPVPQSVQAIDSVVVPVEIITVRTRIKCLKRWN